VLNNWGLGSPLLPWSSSPILSVRGGASSSSDTDKESHGDVDDGEDEDEVSDEIPADPIPADVGETISMEEVSVDEEEVSAETFTAETVVEDATVIHDDGDSSAFVDRMDLADAYDEGETTPGGFDDESSASVVVEESVEVQAKGVVESEVPSEVTKAMAKTLAKLKYSRREIRGIRPDIAAMVIEKNIKRPEEGMPLNFYIKGESNEPTGWRKMLPRIALPAIAGALLVTATMSGTLDPSNIFKIFALGSSSKIPTKPLLESVTTDVTAASSVTETAVPPASDYSVTPDDDDDVVHANEHINKVGEPHPHSIKPGSHDAQDELDVTWLDRTLSKVGTNIKSVFRRK